MNIKDFQFIQNKLGVSEEILKQLTEEEKDKNLLLDAVSIKDIKKEDANQISPVLYTKLATLRYSHDTNFDIEEKVYVSDCIYQNYLSIKKFVDYKLITNKTNSEKKSKYYLTLAGFYYEFVTSLLFPVGYETQIEEGFRQKSRPLAEHTKDWISILREIKKKNWLSPT